MSFLSSDTGGPPNHFNLGIKIFISNGAQILAGSSFFLELGRAGVRRDWEKDGG